MINGQIYSRESWKTAVESLGILSEKWQSDSLKKVQLNLSQNKRRREMKLLMMMMMMQFITSLSDRNTVFWWMVTQHSVYCMYIALPAYQNRSTMRGGDTDGQHDTFSGPSQGSHLPDRPHCRLQGFW
jgi:hypothetical protein